MGYEKIKDDVVLRGNAHETALIIEVSVAVLDVLPASTLRDWRQAMVLGVGKNSVV